MLRKEFCSDLDVVKNLLVDRGNLKIGKVLLNQYASDKLDRGSCKPGVLPHDSCR